MNVKERQMTAKEEEIVLQALGEYVARPRLKFLEVGSWCGDSTIILGKTAEQYGGNLFCVDWWRGNIDTELEDIAARSDIFSLFWKRIQDEGLEDVVIPIRTRSDIIAPLLKGHSFDLVFLDGDHRYNGTLSDIEAYGPLVNKPGGILCGHDCDGRISDFEMEFLRKGKDADVYEGVHCGVVLAAGNSFKNYSIDYNIWSVSASENKEGWDPTNLALAIPKGYRGFKILMRKDKFYAAHHSLGNIDPLKTEEAELRKHEKAGKFVVGNTFDETKRFIEELGPENPEIIEENYKGFSIVRHRKQYYVVSKEVGPVDFMKVKEDSFKKYKKSDKFIIGSSLEEVKRLADEVGPVDPQVLRRDYKGFNIVQYGRQYYGVSEDIGPIDIRKIEGNKLKEYEKAGRCIIRNSFEEVKAIVDKIGPLVPELVEEGYKGFNIVQYGRQYYGVSEDIGHIDIRKIEGNKLKEYEKAGRCIIRNSFEEVKAIVDKIGPLVPELVEEGYKGFNVTLYKGKYHAVHQALSSLDLAAAAEDGLEEYRKQGKCFVSESLEDAKLHIEELVSEIPQLVEDEECPPGFNIVRYRKKYYAVDKALADIDIAKISDDELRRYEETGRCVVCDSLEEAKQVVPELIIEGYRNFNLILYRKKYYAMFQELGEVDVSRPGQWLKECIEKGTAAIGNSLDEIKELATQLYCRHMQNIVDYYSTENHELNSEISIRDKKIHKLNAEVVENITKANDLEKELDEIKSRWWFKLFRNFKTKLKKKLSSLFKKPA